MKNFIKKSLRIALSPFVLPSYFAFCRKQRSGTARFKARIYDFYPQIKDKTVTTGFDRHYVYHTSWAARILAETKPEKHVDISSSLFFAGIASAFVPIEFYDIRPADLKLKGLASKVGNLMKLPFADKSLKSISCMHTVEHVGLGRYGDPIDPDGDIKAAAELSRVLAVGGNLLFVVPVGEVPRIEWNAHRIYTYEMVLAMFPKLRLKEFALISEHVEKGGLEREADPSVIKGERYACGCFLFTRQV